MKILVADFLFVKEHQVLNVNTIRTIASLGEVFVISQKGYYDDFKTEFEQLGVKVIDINVFGDCSTTLKEKFHCIKLMRESSKIFSHQHIDLMLVLAFDTISATLLNIYVPKDKVLLIHHKNLDEIINNRIKRFVFSFYKESVYHIVYEEYFRDKLGEYVSKKRIYYVPHPVSEIESKDKNYHDESYDCVALCNSNNEIFIDNLASLQNIPENISFLIRTKKERPLHPNIKYVRTFLEYTEYNKFINSARYVFVPLPNDYKYRLSGSIYDALSRHKIVLTNSLLHQQGLDKRYPGVVKYVDSAEKLLENVSFFKGNLGLFDKFIQEHSCRYIASCFVKVLNDVCTCNTNATNHKS